MKKILWAGFSIALLIASDSDENNDRQPAKSETTFPIADLTPEEIRAHAVRMREQRMQRPSTAVTAAAQQVGQDQAEATGLQARQGRVDPLRELAPKLVEAIQHKNLNLLNQLITATDPNILSRLQRLRINELDVAQRVVLNEAIDMLRQEREDRETQRQHQVEQARRAAEAQATATAEKEQREEHLRQQGQLAAKEAERAQKAAELNDILTRLDDFFQAGLFSQDGRHLHILQTTYIFWNDQFSDMPFEVWMEEVLPESEALEALLKRFGSLGDNPLKRDFYGYLLFQKIFNVIVDGSGFDCLIDHTSLRAFIEHMKSRGNHFLEDTDTALALFSELAIDNERLGQVIENWCEFRTYALQNLGLFEGSAEEDVTNIVTFITFIETNKEKYDLLYNTVRSPIVAGDLDDRLARKERNEVLARKEKADIERAIMESTQHAQTGTRAQPAQAGSGARRALVDEHQPAAAQDEDFDPEFVLLYMNLHNCDAETAKAIIRAGQ